MLPNQQFLMLIIDDIHFIHSLRHPKASDTSTSIDMATILLDHQPGISAVKRPPDVKQIHRHVTVQLEQNKKVTYRGWIECQELVNFMLEKMENYFQQSFLESLPIGYKKFDLSNF